MGSDTPAAPAAAPQTPLPLGRLAGIGLVIFAANAALLVLQLVSGRLLAPFIGSSLETWTSVIGVFLVGIALGNGLGGRLADRYPSPRTLAALLLVGAVTALWMVVFPRLMASSGAYKAIPLGPRTPLLAFLLCLPAGFVLSLLTPLAIRLGLPDVSKTGRVAGMIFSLSTLGCLIGNYVTGFYLMKTFSLDSLVYLSAGSLILLAGWTLVGLQPGEAEEPATGAPAAPADAPTSTNPHAFPDIRTAYLIVFLSSFGGMTLELTASRVLAQYLGVSLFTWTGVIGVMLAGTSLGNLAGGLIADRVNRPGSTWNPRTVLGGTLIVAGSMTALLLVTQAVLTNTTPFEKWGPANQVLGWSFGLFFFPMLVLGMVSPQVIRLAVPDVAHVGRVAGRVYAWSTAGAIAGTFAAGYVLLSTLGMDRTVMLVALVVTLASLLVVRVWNHDLLLYLFSIVLGGITGGFILNYRSGGRDENLIAQVESNYYTIRVTREVELRKDAAGRYLTDEHGHFLLRQTGRKGLTLDALLHSTVDPENPGFLHYQHEYVQMEFLRGAWATDPSPRVLVIGGGGYTFPRYVMERAREEGRPGTRVDVVEIDPAVTRVAKEHLGLQDYPGLEITHMDGRQFLAEKVAPGTYDLVIQDAVNDLSVPWHLMTKEYNDLVRKALKPGGVYLLTVIDAIEYGKLWKAAFHTLGRTYPPENVCMLTPEPDNLSGRQVYVIYAADRPVDVASLEKAFRDQMAYLRPTTAAATAVGAGVAPLWGTPHTVAAGGAAPEVGDWVVKTQPFFTNEIPRQSLQPYLDVEPVVLTDQFAPTDNLMADVFRYRFGGHPKE